MERKAKFSEEYEDWSILAFEIHAAWPHHYVQEPEILLVTLGDEDDPILEYENTKGLEDPLGG